MMEGAIDAICAVELRLRLMRGWCDVNGDYGTGYTSVTDESLRRLEVVAHAARESIEQGRPISWPDGGSVEYLSGVSDEPPELV